MRKFGFFKGAFFLIIMMLLFGSFMRGSIRERAWYDGYAAGLSADDGVAGETVGPRGSASAHRHHSPFGFLGLCLTAFFFFMTLSFFCKMFGWRKRKAKGWSRHWQAHHGKGKWDGGGDDSPSNVPDYV